MILQAKPANFLSWNATIEREGHRAELRFNWIGESGTIEINGEPCDVNKQGMLSGQWVLALDRVELATAVKSNIFTRSFGIADRNGSFSLNADSAFTRSFTLYHSGNIVAAYRARHFFTRSMNIEWHDEVCTFPTLCFAYWLIAITQHRQAASSS